MSDIKHNWVYKNVTYYTLFAMFLRDGFFVFTHLGNLRQKSLARCLEHLELKYFSQSNNPN